MSDLKVAKARMVMEFNQFIKLSLDLGEHKFNALNMDVSLGDFDVHRPDADEFVDNSLSALSELAKASPEIKAFIDQYSDAEKRKVLSEAVEQKVKNDDGLRLRMEEQVEDAVGDYWRARDNFTKLGGKCLDNTISRSVLEDFALNVGRTARDAFVGTYEQVLAENGPFESKMKELGLSDSATVVRYHNFYPEIAMTPEAEKDVVKAFAELLEKGMETDFADVATPDDYQAIVAGNVRGMNVAMEFHRRLPLADVYVDIDSMSYQEGLDRIETYRNGRKLQKESELSK